MALQLQTETATKTLEGTDILVALGRTPNTHGIGLEQADVEITEKGHVRVNDRLETTAETYGRSESAPVAHTSPTSQRTTSTSFTPILREGAEARVTGWFLTASSPTRRWRASA